MSFTQKALLLASRQPFTQFQRYRGKINIQRPRQPHYDRALILAVTRPIYAPKPANETCFKRNPKVVEKPENPYHAIIAREVYDWFDRSQLIAFFHINSISQTDLFPTRVLLHKQNMALKTYNKKIMTMALENTRFEEVLPLCYGHYYIVFGEQSESVKPLLRITKKVPQLVLLAGIVDNAILSRNELVAYAAMPGIQAAQSELVGTLNMAASKLAQQLETHQNNLVNILDIYAKSPSEPSESTKVKEETSAAKDINNEDDKSPKN